jgi:twitching motility protein PilT
LSEVTREIDRFLKKMVELNGSDLHIKSGSTPRVRINGQLADLSREVLSPQAVDAILEDVMTPQVREDFGRQQEVDFIYQLRNSGRFRINVYQQMNGVAMAVRHIRMDIPAFEELYLPTVLSDLINRPRGLILVVGATGSGKSTTLAAMVETLNRTAALNIITIESPIEYAFKEKKATIQQREVGRDTPSWSVALRNVIRMDPDVIMLGEIRDSETMLTALSAANTGHLVLASLYTMDAGQAIHRVLSFAPPEMTKDIRHQLASTLVCIVAQRLIARKDGDGRIPAVELLVNNENISNIITDSEQSGKIRHAIAEGSKQFGMQTFDQSLMYLVRANLVSLEEAQKQASNPSDFRIRMRGIEGQG